jgi:hypothetical protein
MARRTYLFEAAMSSIDDYKLAPPPEYDEPELDDPRLEEDNRINAYEATFSVIRAELETLKREKSRDTQLLIAQCKLTADETARAEKAERERDEWQREAVGRRKWEVANGADVVEHETAEAIAAWIEMRAVLDGPVSRVLAADIRSGSWCATKAGEG